MLDTEAWEEGGVCERLMICFGSKKSPTENTVGGCHFVAGLSLVLLR